MDKSYLGGAGQTQAANNAANQIRTPAVDILNQRLAAAHSTLSEAISRINMVANKVTGAAPPVDKAGAPAAVSSCAMDWLNDIDSQLGNLITSINRLD